MERLISIKHARRICCDCPITNGVLMTRLVAWISEICCNIPLNVILIWRQVIGSENWSRTIFIITSPVYNNCYVATNTNKLESCSSLGILHIQTWLAHFCLQLVAACRQLKFQLNCRAGSFPLQEPLVLPQIENTDGENTVNTRLPYRHNRTLTCNSGYGHNWVAGFTCWI